MKRPGQSYISQYRPFTPSSHSALSRSSQGPTLLPHDSHSLRCIVQMVWVFIMNRMGSQGSTVTQQRRMALGVVILLLVDVIWYIFKRQEYNKPFVSTFTKTSKFVLYLLGFLLWRPWRQQCTGSLRGRHAAFSNLQHLSTVFADAEAYFTPCINNTSLNDHTLSEPLYVPVKFQDHPTEQTNCANGDCDSSEN
ncbi:hypothetical protein J4Q44_G00200870 [Coregonus suidteri]|uniref:Solute carrier family 35 member F5 n=1 Tax=Coregonus suidteri TaxID=861788 RepID=A0AAN8QTA3_9TELE